MGEQLLNNSILDQFVNSHEQSYEEFLNTFTYLLQEDRGKTAQGSNLDSLRKPFSTISDLPNRNQQDGSSGGSKEMWVSLSPQTPSEDKIESCKAGGCGGNDLSLSEGVKVDKSLDLEDVETEETCTAPHEQQFCACSWASFGSSKAQDKIELLHAWKFKSGSLVLPGQVEQTVTYCTPFFEKPVQQKLRTLAAPEPPDSKAQELLGDDVQPFSLDEEFDYDNVALTPKFSEAELKAILEFSEEKKTGTDVKSAGAGD